MAGTLRDVCLKVAVNKIWLNTGIYKMTTYRLATFSADVTPTVGQPLCGGWYGTAISITDPLEASGVVILGGEHPVVLCAIDFALLGNDSYLQWTQTLAEAAGTLASHVTIHCSHAHCTPWPDVQGQAMLAPYPDVPQFCDQPWCDQALKNIASAVREAVAKARPVTHVGLGQAAVDRVASNRRIIGADGKSKGVRYTATRDPLIRDEPVGTIDPWLRTVSFWNDQTKLAALHYYAVHPTSFDRDRKVTSEFVGRARRRISQQQPGVLHAYFTGCAGNVTAGKYNDGSPPMRELLADRIYTAMLASEADTDRFPMSDVNWQIEPILLPVNPVYDDMDKYQKILADPTQTPGVRNRAAFILAFLMRRDRPMFVSCLTLADRIKLLHLPAESFIEYQLYAQAKALYHTVATAAYGDGGPMYICLDRSYNEGGYEPSDSLVGPGSQAIMEQAIERCVSGVAKG